MYELQSEPSNDNPNDFETNKSLFLIKSKVGINPTADLFFFTSETIKDDG
jgi:hypothetical protein